MASEVSIGNRSLDKLGATHIVSLEDRDPKAVALKEAYPVVRDAELRRHRYRFSLGRALLAASDTPPEFGFDFAYPLPTDCLQVIQIGEYDLGPTPNASHQAPTELWSIEAREILTDFAAPLKIRYVRRITDVGLFDSCFLETFASRLGYETCYRITGSNEREDRCLRDYRIGLKEGVRANAVEVAPTYPTDDTWVTARLG